MRVTQDQYDEAVRNLKELKEFVESMEVEEAEWEGYFPTKQKKDSSYMLCLNGDVCGNYSTDELLVERGWYYVTREQAVRADKERLALVKVIRRKQELSKGSAPVNWEGSQEKYYPCCDHPSLLLIEDWCIGQQSLSDMWYTTKAGVWKQIIDEMSEDVRIAMGIWQ